MHSNAIMAEEQPVSAFARHRRSGVTIISSWHIIQLAEDEIYGEYASEETVAAMAMKNMNFVAEQRALDEAACAHAGCIAVVAKTILDGNAGSCASFVPPVQFAPGCYDHEAGPSTSIVDLTFTSDLRATDSDEEE